MPAVQDDLQNAGVLGTFAGLGTSVNTTTSLAGTLLDAAFPALRHAETLAATTSACSLESHAAAHTPAASAHYAASAPTPGASAVPALMSSIPFSPWIRTSESILRYRPLAGGDGVSHPVTYEVSAALGGALDGPDLET